MDILSIGNSFSQDAHRYLHRIAKADGERLRTFNLYIGGCALEGHHRNMQSEEKAYILEMNGTGTGFYASLKEALENRAWDVVTLQQASWCSFKYESYHPYLNELIDYIRKLSPSSKIALHETWAYEEGSEKIEKMGYKTHKEMLSDVTATYKRIADEIKPDFYIPSGEVFGALLENGIKRIHRDPIHASLGVGRYALGLIWYKTLMNKDVKNNSFKDFAEEITPEELEIIKRVIENQKTSYLHPIK